MGDHKSGGHDQQGAGKDNNDPHQLDKGIKAFDPLFAVLDLEDAWQGLQIIGKSFDPGEAVKRTDRIDFNGGRQEIGGHSGQDIAVVTELLFESLEGLLAADEFDPIHLVEFEDLHLVLFLHSRSGLFFKVDDKPEVVAEFLANMQGIGVDEVKEGENQH